MIWLNIAVSTYLVLRVLTASEGYGLSDYEYWLTIGAALSVAVSGWSITDERKRAAARARIDARARRSKEPSGVE